MRFYEMAKKDLWAGSLYYAEVVPETQNNDPTFHFWCRDSKRRFKAIVKIKTLELVGFEKPIPKEKSFTREERKALLKWLKEPVIRDEHKRTGWEWLIAAWNIQNDSNIISVGLPLPNIKVSDFLSEDVSSYEAQETISIKEEVKIGNYILEVGDKIQLVEK